MKENTLKHIKKLEYLMIVLSRKYKFFIIISTYLIIYIRINFYWGGTWGYMTEHTEDHSRQRNK